MVQFNTTALLAIVFGALSVAGASVRNLEFQARSAELSELIEARDLAYFEYEARDLELNERADEMESRGFSTSHLLYRRIDETFKVEILTWLHAAQATGAAQFGDGKWSPMHSGGTSTPPHCRPYGLMRTETVGSGKAKVTHYDFQVKLECAPNSKKPNTKVTVVDPFSAGTANASTGGPSNAQLYAQLIAHVAAL